MSLADSKLKTKNFLSSRGIPFAETYFTIASQQELHAFSLQSISATSFVIKPNKWSRGRGILIVKKEKGNFLIQDEIWTEEEIKLHMIDILHGSFSLHGSSDTIIIEELLAPGSDFQWYCRYGLADIRVVVYNYVPVIAMVRIPTPESGNKANLDLWAIWLGVNIANGEILSFYQNQKTYSHAFPAEFSGLKGKTLPFWDDILLLSSQVQMFSGLGFVGMDWVITKNGPKLLEINARAGLKIQNVNRVPLENRLKKIDWLKVLSPEKWVEIAKTLFHTETLFSEKWKKILYLEQNSIVGDREVIVKIDIQKKNSTVSKDIIDFLWNHPVHIFTDSHVSVLLDQFDIVSDEKNTIILWTEILKDYLINPSIYVVNRKIENDVKWTKELIDFDDAVYRVSRKINLSSLLKPENYFALLDEFIANPIGFNPVFRYRFPDDKKIEFLKSSLDLLMEKALWFRSIWLDIAELYREKIEEIQNKLSLVQAYKTENHEEILRYNSLLFWETNTELLQIATEKVLLGQQNKTDDAILWRILTLDQIISAIHAYFETHNIKKIPISIESGNLSRMSVSYGKDVKIHISRNAVIREKEIDAILTHEIGTHFKRYLAGQTQWLKLFQYGTGYYLADEEWFAIYRSFSHLPAWYEKNAMYVKYYLLGMTDTLSFSETIDLLRTLYPEKTLESLFSDAVRLKRWIIHSGTRGIPWTTYQKDKMYLDGYMRVKDWIEKEGGNAEKLFFWKIKIQDLKIIEFL